MSKPFPARQAQDICDTIDSQAFKTNQTGFTEDLMDLIAYGLEQTNNESKAVGFPAAIQAGQTGPGVVIPSNEEIVGHLRSMIGFKTTARDATAAAPNIPWATIIQWALTILQQILGGITPPAPAPAKEAAPMVDVIPVPEPTA